MGRIYFESGEEVEYLSQYDFETWKRGVIERFTEDGLQTVAIIEEEIDGRKGKSKIPMVNKYIRKI